MSRTHLARLSSVLLLLALLAAAVAAPQAAGAASASPATVRPGERVNFSAAGFTPGERIDFWVTGPDGISRPRFPAVEADANGAVVWSWDVPADAPGGQWTAVARGVRSNRQVPVGFTVIAAPAPARELAAEPPAGAPGTTFRFTVGGLTPGEGFGPWLRGPDGRDRDIGAPGSFVPLAVAEDGRLSWSWTPPADAAPGQWFALARGERSGTTVEVPFAVIGPGQPAPERSVTPAEAPPGTTFSFAVGGFQPGEAGGSWLNTPGGARLDATPYLKVDDEGVARWTWTAPANAQAGPWQAVTRGEESRREVVVAFAVTGANPGPTPVPGATGSVEPAAGPPRGEFRFTVSGFARDERELAYWFTDAKGAPVRADEKIEVDADGRASWTWTAPRLAEPGTWVMTARGRYSFREVQIPFTIVRGFCMGAADVVPGVSGGTVALVFGIYHRLITAVQAGSSALGHLVNL
ncbi:MAG TPA: DUF368 domain-containing protein, partial [Chloroflexaceae bacterium]|nr:DUF368 domain-containing protein [Chloroflexaceae bacterium]